MLIRKWQIVKTTTRLLVVIGLIWILHHDSQKETVCLESSMVVEIMSIHHRSGIVKLANGNRASVNQPSEPITVGHDYCLKSERR